MRNWAKILVVDDIHLNLVIMEDELSAHGHEIMKAYNGHQAIKMAHEKTPDIILMDVLMPGIDGFETCRQLKERPETANIPVIMVTSLNDREAKLKGLEAGALDFISRPIDFDEISKKINNLLGMQMYQRYLEDNNKLLEKLVSIRTREIEEAFTDTIYHLGVATEYKDYITSLHTRRVGHYTQRIAQLLGLPEETGKEMFYASQMHDVGKIGIADNILLKAADLTIDEFDTMKTHTTIGAKILSSSKSELLKTAEKFALYHHEKWDGTGYPNKLRGEKIPIEGRIMKLADVYDALRSARPYKLAYDHKKTFNIILHGDGKTMPHHFDPLLMEAFIDCHQEFEEIYTRYS